jgi:hypothetical protein
MLDEFDDLSHSTHPYMAQRPGADGAARHRFTVARLIARVYRAANEPLRADMLGCLLRPLGTLSLVAVASGAFARLLQHDGAAPERVALDEVGRFSSDHVFELAQFVHEESPQALQQVATMLLQDAASLPALSLSAVFLLYRNLHAAPASSIEHE